MTVYCSNTSISRVMMLMLSQTIFVPVCWISASIRSKVHFANGLLAHERKTYLSFSWSSQITISNLFNTDLWSSPNLYISAQLSWHVTTNLYTTNLYNFTNLYISAQLSWHVTTAQLSWHVQNCGLIVYFKLKEKLIFLRFQLWVDKPGVEYESTYPINGWRACDKLLGYRD